MGAHLRGCGCSVLLSARLRENTSPWVLFFHSATPTTTSACLAGKGAYPVISLKAIRKDDRNSA